MPKQPFIMQTQPDLHGFMEIAGILAGMNPEAIVSVGIRNKDAVENDPTLLEDLHQAIFRSRDALVIWNPGINKNVTQWVSGPAEDMISQGPCSTLRELGHVPQGHVIIGLTESDNEVVRGQVLEDQKVDWSWEIDKQRLAVADRLLDGPETAGYLDDHNYTHIMNEDWHSDGDEWICVIQILDGSGFEDTVEMSVIFESDSDRIIRVDHDGDELCLDELEDNSPQP